jgi:hypothetical protein
MAYFPQLLFDCLDAFYGSIFPGYPLAELNAVAADV